MLTLRWTSTLAGGWILALAVACRHHPEVEPEQALRDPVLSERGEAAYAVLRDTSRFTDAAIYAGGGTPVEVVALRHLWDEPGARQAFLRLLDEADLGGQLFALCGLYYEDVALFRSRVEDYVDDPRTVFFQSGCSGMPDMPLRELVASSRENVVRLESPEQTVREWVASRDVGDRALVRHRWRSLPQPVQGRRWVWRGRAAHPRARGALAACTPEQGTLAAPVQPARPAALEARDLLHLLGVELDQALLAALDVSLRGQLHVAAVGLHLPGVAAVLELQVEDAAQLLLQRRVLDRAPGSRRGSRGCGASGRPSRWRIPRRRRS